MLKQLTGEGCSRRTHCGDGLNRRDRMILSNVINEPPLEKTNNVVSEQVQHKSVQAQKMARDRIFWI